MNDKPFGKFKFDHACEVYKASVSHRNHDLKISIRVDDGYTLEDALPIAEDFWKQRGKWFKASREWACSELLETINSRIEDSPGLSQISKTAFSKSLTVPDEIQLEIDDDQKWFELSYYSGLYGEHVVNVAINMTYDSIDADVSNLY